MTIIQWVHNLATFSDQGSSKIAKRTSWDTLNNAFHKSCYYEEGMESASYLVGTMINCKEISFEAKPILSWEIKKSTI